MLHRSDLTEEQAELICGWKYEGEYGVYNTSWETVQKQKWAIADREKRRTQFEAVLDERNALFGYFRLVEDGNSVMIGLGLNPQDCSKGYGSELMKLILAECSRRFSGKTPGLEVREFNLRAIKCYKKAGFQITDRYTKSTLTGTDTFLLMRYIHTED